MTIEEKVVWEFDPTETISVEKREELPTSSFCLYLSEQTTPRNKWREWYSAKTQKVTSLSEAEAFGRGVVEAWNECRRDDEAPRLFHSAEFYS